MSKPFSTVPRSPPSPKQSALAQTANWILDPLHFLETTQRQLGDVFTTRVVGWETLLLVSDPTLIREIFSTDPAMLQAGKANDLMGPVLGPHSVFLLDGMEHRQVRRILVNAFSLEASRNAADFSARRAAELASEMADGQFHDAHRFFSEVALATMLNAVLGISERSSVTEYAKQFHLVLGGLSTYLAYLRFLQKDFGFGSPGWWIRTKMGALYRLIERDLASSLHRDNPPPAAQIHAALRSADIKHADLTARDQIVSLVVAGHDTVASALSWSLFWLLKNPTIISAIRTELASPTVPAIENTPLLDAVCHEALRLVPTVEIVSRQAMANIQLGEFVVPKGTLVSPCIYLLHRNETLYPEPDKFDPSRFLNRQFAAHEYIPFGGGLRRCLGSHLGLLEMKNVLATLLLNFDFEPIRIDRVKAQRRNVTIAPSPNFRVRFKRR